MARYAIKTHFETRITPKKSSRQNLVQVCTFINTFDFNNKQNNSKFKSAEI